MSTEKIPLAGVIGSPISHSKSPLLHQHWLRTYGVKGFYIPMDVATSDLETGAQLDVQAGSLATEVVITPTGLMSVAALPAPELREVQGCGSPSRSL